MISIPNTLMSKIPNEIAIRKVLNSITKSVQQSQRKFQKAITRPIPPSTYGKYIDNLTIIKDLTRAVDWPPMGVHVYWSPQGTGKSTYLRKVCHDLRQTGSADVIYIDNLNPLITTNGSPYDALQTECGLTAKHLGLGLSTQLKNRKQKQRFLIAIDNFDQLYSCPDIERTMVCLAEESSNEKEFTVIVAVDDPIIATNILGLNGGIKFASIGGSDPMRHLWSTQQIIEFTNSLIRTPNRASNKQHAQLLHLATTSKNQRFIEGLCKLKHPNSIFDPDLTNLAHKYGDLWENGRSIMKNFRLRH